MPDEQAETARAKSPSQGTDFGDFLTATPPDVDAERSGTILFTCQRRTSCCTAIRKHAKECVFSDAPRADINITSNNWQFDFIHYTCRNCQKKSKIFSLAVRRGEGLSGAAMKLGEIPPFGPHTPARVITLIGPDRDLFLQGRRAENHGMGIGAVFTTDAS